MLASTIMNAKMLVSVSMMILALSSTARAYALEVVSHKGVHIPFRNPPPKPDECDHLAEYIISPSDFPVANPYLLENTLPAVSEAFKAGATMVSINPQAT